MSDSVYAELVAAGAPELDLAAGEFYRICAMDSQFMYGWFEVSIRRRNLDRRHWWQPKSWLVFHSQTTVDVNRYPNREEIEVFAQTCKTAHGRVIRALEERRAIEKSERLLGDHP